MIISPLYFEALKATIFSLVIIWLTSLLFGIDLKAFNAFQSINPKFEYTDIYYSKIYEPKTYPGDIVLINIAEAKRREIADLLFLLSKIKTQAIGLDLSFSGRTDSISDKHLSKAIAASKNLVLVTSENVTKDALFYSHPNISVGSNQLITDAKGIVKYIDLSSNSTFAQEIIKTIGLKQTNKYQFSEINYHGVSDHFLKFEATELSNPKIRAQIKDKIVIVGYAGKKWNALNEVEDRFFTPLDFSVNRLNLPPTPGMVIHANVVNNLLNDSFIKISPKWVDYLILFVLLIISNLFYIKNFKRMSNTFFIKSRLFQIILLAIVSYSIFLIFDVFKIKFALVHWIVALIGSFELSMIYVYLLNHLGNKYGVPSYIYNKLKS